MPSSGMSEQIVARAEHEARGSRVQIAEISSSAPGPLEVLDRAHSIEHVRVRGAPTRPARASARERIALGEQRAGDRSLVRAIEAHALDQEPRDPRMRGDAAHRSADLRHAARAERAEELEQSDRTLERSTRRRFEPRKRRKIALAEAAQLQRRPGEIDAADLGLLALRHRTLLGLAPESQTDPRRRAPRTTGALLRGGARDARELEAVETDGRVVAQDAREARVDDRGDAFDRDGGLGDVRREDDLAAVGGPGDGVLLVGGEIAVEVEEREPLAIRERGQRLVRAPGLPDAREEREDVARSRIE